MLRNRKKTALIWNEKDFGFEFTDLTSTIVNINDKI